MAISMADIVKLRQMTSAGMMDCKNALTEAEGDMERAMDIIREKGKMVAAKRSDRSASEGVVVARVAGTKAYMLCLACETDFVAKNKGFVASANDLLDIAVNNDAADTDALMALKEDVASIVTQQSGQTGEKVELAFYARIEAAYVTSYIHTNNKLGTLIGFNKVISEELAQEVAMQAAAMAPVAIDEASVPAEILAKELEIGREQARLDGKPEAMLDKIAEGKVKKYIKENTLLNQDFVQNNKVTVAQHIASVDKEATVVAYVRFSLND